MNRVVPAQDVRLRRQRRQPALRPRLRPRLRLRRALDAHVDVRGAAGVVARADGEQLEAALRVRGRRAAERPGGEVVRPGGVGLPGVDLGVRDGVAARVFDGQDEQEGLVLCCVYVRDGGGREGVHGEVQ